MDVEFTQVETGLDNKLIHPKLLYGVIQHTLLAAHQPCW